MVQSVILIIGSNLNIGCSCRNNIIVHGNVDKVKIIDASGGVTVKELFPDNPINMLYHGSNLSLQYSDKNIIVVSGNVEEYSIISTEGELLAKYVLEANGIYVKPIELE